MADIRITPFASRGDKQPVMDRSTAQRQDYGFRAASTSGELEGLVKGLSALNPALNEYAQQSAQDAARQANIEGRAAGERADMSQIAASELAGQPLPTSVPPAFDNAYRNGLRGVLASRAGASVKQDMLTQYNEQKDTEGFDPGTFLNKFRSTTMAAFLEPSMAVEVGGHINQAEVAIRSDLERTRMTRQLEATEAAFTEVVRDKLSPTMTSSDLLASYTMDILPAARAINKSPKDAAKVLFNRISVMSDQVGGAPQMFDVFEKEDAEGMTLASRNPELAAQIINGKQAAQQQLTAGIIKRTQVNLFKSIDELDKMPSSAITVDLLSPMIGETNIFTNFNQAHAYLQKRQSEVNRGSELAAVQDNWNNRTMGRLPPDLQKDVAEANLGPAVDQLFKAAQAGDPQQVAGLAAQLAKEISYRELSVPLPALERFLETLNTGLPNKEGPDRAFLAKAELFKAFSPTPQFRSMYFKGDSEKLMDRYQASMTAGSTSEAAYAMAYQSISPEAKRAAEVAAKDPKFLKAAQGTVNEVIGSSFWPQVFGGNGRPNNDDVVSADAYTAMLDYKRQNPNAGADEVATFAKGYVANNYVHDTASGNVVKVPKQFANQRTQQALSAYSEDIMAKARLSSRNDGDWQVEYRPEGTEGSVMVVLKNGDGAVTPVGRTTFGNIVQADLLKKEINHNPGPNGEPSEALRLQEVRRQVESGQVDPGFMAANRELVTKARALKLMPMSVVQKMDKAVSDGMREQLKSIPRVSFGKPDYSDLSTIPKRGTAVVNNKVTAQVANQFANAPMMGPGLQHQGLAASLITMGEGVVLQAYPDPAKDAGNNIGAGYNLKANAANAPSDLKRAGVPESLIQDVIAGKRQMTTEQVMRLTQVAMPRYENLARDTAEKTSPGLWAKMTPPQKAVMIDVAYQVGSVDQFRRAWSALANGDQEGFIKEAQTTYVNQSGERVTDKRRNTLRAAMLGGSPQWSATIDKYGSLPGSALDVAALNRK